MTALAHLLVVLAALGQPPPPYLFRPRREVKIEEYAYARITDVKVQRLSNAVRIVFTADGVLRAEVDPEHDRPAYYEYVGAEQRLKATTRAPFTIWNARSAVGNFVDVSYYPVSHVEIAPMSESALGIGLRMALVLYEPAGAVQVFDFRGRSAWRWRRDEGIEVTFDILLSQDRKKIIITVHSSRYMPPAPPKYDPEKVGAYRYLEVRAADNRISVFAVNAAVDALVSEVAKATGAALGIEPDMRGYVTLNLPNVTVQEFVNTLACACGYGVVVSDSRTVFTRPRANVSSYVGGKSRQYPVKYIPAAQVVALLPDAVLPFVHVDAAHNAVVATAPKPVLDKLEQTIRALDRPFPQIRLDVLTVEATKRSTLHKVLSLSFGRGPLRFALDTLLGTVFFAHTGPPPAAAQSFTIAPLALAGLDLFGEISAVAQRTEGVTVSQGQITTLNGNEAELFAGQRRWVILKVRYYKRFIRESLQYIDVGTRVRATPLTGDGETITLNIEPEVVSIVSVDEYGLPTIATRSAEASVRVRAGETVLIAGLQYFYKSESREKVPVLSDIPLLGSLVKGRQLHQEATEAVMFVTPRVVRGESMDIPFEPFPPPREGKPWPWEQQRAPQVTLDAARGLYPE